MSCDSVGVFGSKLKGPPVMDRLASSPFASNTLMLRWVIATLPKCDVFRSDFTQQQGGRFYKVPEPGWPHMVDLLKDAGYYTGIMEK